MLGSSLLRVSDSYLFVCQRTLVNLLLGGRSNVLSEFRCILFPQQNGSNLSCVNLEQQVLYVPGCSYLHRTYTQQSLRKIVHARLLYSHLFDFFIVFSPPP